MSSSHELTSATTIVRTAEQVCAELDGKVVLLSIENGEYYHMNEVASRLWGLLEKPVTIGALIEQLVAEFDVDAATCQQDAMRFLTALQKDKLLRVV